jgi:hypothetical protein
LSVYWNPLQSEEGEDGPCFAPKSQSKGTFERTVSFDGGEFRRQIRNDVVTIFFNWTIDHHFAPKSQSKGASEAPFYREGPRAFEDVFLAKNCKVIFQIGDKKLEILEFQNPQTITGRSDTIRFPEEESLSCSQTRIFKTLN